MFWREKRRKEKLNRVKNGLKSMSFTTGLGHTICMDIELDGNQTLLRLTTIDLGQNIQTFLMTQEHCQLMGLVLQEYGKHGEFGENLEKLGQQE